MTPYTEITMGILILLLKSIIWTHGMLLQGHMLFHRGPTGAITRFSSPLSSYLHIPFISADDWEQKGHSPLTHCLLAEKVRNVGRWVLAKSYQR